MPLKAPSWVNKQAAVTISVISFGVGILGAGWKARDFVAKAEAAQKQASVLVEVRGELAGLRTELRNHHDEMRTTHEELAAFGNRIDTLSDRLSWLEGATAGVVPQPPLRRKQ